MGLAKMFGWNGVNDFIDPRRNMLLGASAGFLSGDLGNVPLYAMQGKQADDAYAQAEAEKADRANRIKTAAAAARASGAEQLAAMIEGSGDIGTGIGMFNALDKGSSNTFADNATARQTLGNQYGLTGEELTRYVLTGEMPGGNQSNRAGVGQPIPVRNKVTHETSVAMPMTDGTYQNPFTQQAFDDQWEFDPAWVAAQKAGGATLGKEQAGAAASLPGLETNVNIALDALNRIRDNPQGLKEHFSQAPMLPRDIYVAPGTPLGNLKGDLDQALGQSFMQAREGLKGGGQITDFEGRKAEEAYTRMRKAYEVGDAKAFASAMDEFEYYLRQGFEKMKAFAAGQYTPGDYGAGGGDGGVDDILKKHGVIP